MTTLTLNDITEAVLRLMDENGGNYQFMQTDDATGEMRQIIRQVTEDSVRKIHLQAPIVMLDAVTSPVSTHMEERNGRYVCSVLVPDDFFRLVRCSMASWASPVTQLWWEDSAEYAKQKNRYLMGTAERPKAFLIHRASLKWVEMYSSDDINDTLREFLYDRVHEWYKDMIMVSDRLKDACLMQIAADTLGVLGESERSQSMQARALGVLDTYGGMERHYADNGQRIEK